MSPEELVAQANRIDDIGVELADKYEVPDELLTPIHVHAVKLREQAFQLLTEEKEKP